MLQPVERPENQVEGWINIAVKGGFVTGSDSIPLPLHLFTEGLITKDQYDRIKDKPCQFSMEARYLSETEYTWQDKKKRSYNLRGTTVIDGKTYGVNLKTGKDTVSAKYLLAGLLLVGNPFEGTITIASDVVSTKSGQKVVKLWVNGQSKSPRSFDEIKDLDCEQRFQLLLDLYPDNVYTPEFDLDAELAESPL